MRKETTHKFYADDGKAFDTPEECKAYELRDGLRPLLKMTQEHLDAILRGEDETRAALMRRVVSAISSASGKKKAPKRSKEEIAAALEAKIAKLRGHAVNGSGSGYDETVL